MTKVTRFFSAGILGGLTAFLSGWIIYGVLFMDYLKANKIQYYGLMKNVSSPGPKEWLALLIGQMAVGFLFAFVFNRFPKISAFSGMVSGAIIMLLFIIFIDMNLFAEMNLIGKKYIMADALASLLNGGLIGLVTGWWLGKKPVFRS